MSEDTNRLVQAASDSLFAPESLDDIRCRLSFIEASECNCGEGPHENAIHDLIKDDVPVLFHVIHCLAAELKAARAEVERLRPQLAEVVDELERNAECNHPLSIHTAAASESGAVHVVATGGPVTNPLNLLPDWLAVTVLYLAITVGGAVALWLAWLALTAFFYYGLEAITWVLT